MPGLAWVWPEYHCNNQDSKNCGLHPGEETQYKLMHSDKVEV